MELRVPPGPATGGGPPLVSIGIPVCNEARFLADALASLLAQDYPNLELIISDNASTDGTDEIARQLAAAHPAIRCHRFAVNQGPAANFQFVLDEARGRYFMWAAGHDRWSPNYVSACVELLESHERAVLALGCSRWIGEAGEPLGRESGWTDTRGLGAVARYVTVLWGNMHPVYGLMRLDALRGLQLPNTVGADLILLARLALLGDFLHAPGVEWQRREFRAEASYAEKLRRYRSREFRLAASPLARLFPLARLPLALVGDVLAAPRTWGERLGILALLLPSLPVHYLVGRSKGRRGSAG
jgi:glycosyltransferase involved in cell wall biosynthesis